MYTMERTQIYLSEEEREALDRRAEESGQTRSHLIREAIAAYLQQPTKSELEQAIEANAGAWGKRSEAADVDGATYVERLRTGRRWQDLYPGWGTGGAEPAARPAGAAARRGAARNARGK